MSDLKSCIFSLIKKCPDIASTWDDGSYLGYKGPNEVEYCIQTNKKRDFHPEDYPDFVAEINIEKETAIFETVPLTEKEFMEIKWKTQEWEKVLREKALDAFKEFAESDPTSMDDLLND